MNASFSAIDAYHNQSKRRRINSPLFSLFLIFLKKMENYYRYDPDMLGLSNELLYQIKYIYNNFNGRFPISIHINIVELNNLSDQLPAELSQKWKLFYDKYYELSFKNIN